MWIKLFLLLLEIKMHKKVYVEVCICTFYTTAKFEVFHYNIVALCVYCITCRSVVMQCGNIQFKFFFFFRSSLLFVQRLRCLIHKHFGCFLKFLWCTHFSNHSLTSCSLPTHPMSEIVTFQHTTLRTLLPPENMWTCASPCLRISDHISCKMVI
jgi:hypothetical protein